MALSQQVSDDRRKVALEFSLIQPLDAAEDLCIGRTRRMGTLRERERPGRQQQRCRDTWCHRAHVMPLCVGQGRHPWPRRPHNGLARIKTGAHYCRNGGGGQDSNLRNPVRGLTVCTAAFSHSATPPRELSGTGKRPSDRTPPQKAPLRAKPQIATRSAGGASSSKSIADTPALAADDLWS